MELGAFCWPCVCLRLFFNENEASACVMFVYVYRECTEPFQLIHSSNVPKG